jgi:hypothetical protein
MVAYSIWDTIQFEHRHRSEHIHHCDEERNHREPTSGQDDHITPLVGGEQIAARVELRAVLSGASVPLQTLKHWRSQIECSFQLRLEDSEHNDSYKVDRESQEQVW